MMNIVDAQGKRVQIPKVPMPGFAGIRARAVIAFDVDGTLENSQGPVPVERLTMIQSQFPHLVVVIVSPSTKRPPGFYEEVSGDRLANLNAVRGKFPADLYFYVSDNGDQELAKKAGFTYITAKDFV